MKNKLKNLLNGESENHILPFFWQHGEDDETLLLELHRIYDSGIRAVCVESRPDEDFGLEPWFEDMRLIIAECRKLGMEFWLLDDKRFPTGIANYLLKEKYPHLGKHAVTERHTDVAGPCSDCAVIIQNWLGVESKPLGVVACERYAGDGQKMTGRTIDLTENVNDGMVFFDVPDGLWRIFTIYDIPVNDSYIDMLNEESVHVLIEAVYEPHYRELGEYFGSTFRGYFSDEPFIMQNSKLPVGDECRSNGIFPWNDNVKSEMISMFGDSWIERIPALWFPSDGAAELRVGYMDTVTKLYSKCFTYQLGNWARSHGVEYIGHIVEDDGMHTALRTGAHFFRALDGQDMAGIDVVLCQIVPGMTQNIISVPCSYDIANNEFFHFGLAKLGSSHAHIQPEKHGRAMCEIYGAYGWAEGLPMMKWLTDHMLVRGINNFVPHAFSPKFPDHDCPPHFYAAGHNPEYRGFGKLMKYMNRVSTIISDGRHYSTCAVLYHAEAEWSGGRYMKFEKPAKILTESGLDFDVVSEDYLAKAVVRHGKMCLADEEYPCIIVPYAEILPQSIIDDLHRMADGGVSVIFVDRITEKNGAGLPVSHDGFSAVPLHELPEVIHNSGFSDITASGENITDLRYFHYSRNGGHVYFLTNEGTDGAVDADIAFSIFSGGNYVKYDPMENQAVMCSSDICSGGKIRLTIEPYNSVMLFFGDIPDEIEEIEPEAECELIDTGVNITKWTVSTAEPEEYDPTGEYPADFKNEFEITDLYNIARENPRFAGFVKYETNVSLESGEYQLDLGRVGEVSYVWISGKYCGEKINPPHIYKFNVNTDDETSQITVVTTSNLAYKMRDGFSSFLRLDPVGLLGAVKIKNTNYKNYKKL